MGLTGEPTVRTHFVVAYLGDVLGRAPVWDMEGRLRIGDLPATVGVPVRHA